MSVLTSVGGYPAALAGTPMSGIPLPFAYTNNRAAGMGSAAAAGLAVAPSQQQQQQQQTVNVPLTPVAASAGFLLNNTYQVQPVAPSAVTPNGFFSAYASSLGTGGPFVKGVQAYEAATVAPSRPQAILAAANDAAAVSVASDNDYRVYNPQFAPDAGSLLARKAVVNETMPIPVPAPVFAAFPQSVPVTAVGTAMLQNAASVTGGIRNGDAMYALNLSSLWGGANIRPLFYATPVGFGMTQTCDCTSSLGNCPRPCNFGQAWRF
jgi:hypothetical protein